MVRRSLLKIDQLVRFQAKVAEEVTQQRGGQRLCTFFDLVEEATTCNAASNLHGFMASWLDSAIAKATWKRTLFPAGFSTGLWRDWMELFI